MLPSYLEPKRSVCLFFPELFTHSIEFLVKSVLSFELFLNPFNSSDLLHKYSNCYLYHEVDIFNLLIEMKENHGRRW